MMQGLKGTTNIRASATVNLNNLRRTVAWSSQRSGSVSRRVEALSDRLESLLVLELLKDGNRRYLSLSVRGLYQHVLACITNRSQLESTVSASASPVSRRATIGLPLAEGLGASIPAPLAGAGMELGDVAEDRTTEHDEQEEPRTSLQDVHTNADNGTPLVPPPRMPSIAKPRRHMRTASVGVEALQDAEKSGEEVTYRERLGGYLHPRDMRRLVTPFSATNEPELIVRRHVILLNFDPLRTIILRDRLLVIVPDGADSVLTHLETRVRGGNDEVEAEIFGTQKKSLSNPPSLSSQGEARNENFIKRLFRTKLPALSRQGADHPSGGDLSSLGRKSAASEMTEDNESTPSEANDDDMNNEWDEINRNEWVTLPFELQCVDAVLHVVSALLQEDTYELQEASLEYIQRLLSESGGMSDDPLTIIRAVKDALREMNSRVKSFVTSLTRTLDEDEDMALMNLSRLLTCPERFIQPVSPEVLEEESDEPELILEAHLQTALTLLNALDLMQGQIDTAAELIDQKLDAVRNRLLYANMVISILSLCVAAGSLVGSIFGMNLKNYMEDDDTAFRKVTFGTLAGAVSLAFLIMVFLTFSGTIPRVNFASAQPSL